MLEVQESFTPLPFDPTSIELRTDVELDALPFGVIALDERGVVLRYNLYESRLARLDRSQVLGRNFFTEIARCTRTEAFEGCFRRLVASPGPARAKRFDYTFDFAFGAQEVVVEMVRPGNLPRVYLFINRTAIKDARPSFPQEDLAALQSALAPGEPALGVRRDAFERRVVEVEWSMLSALRATCDRLAPETWPVFCSEWGVSWGRRLAVDLESGALELHGRSLGEIPTSAFVAMLEDHLRERGFGLVSMDLAEAHQGVVAIRVDRSALAEAVRPGGRTTSASVFACPLLAGCLGAVLSHVAQRRVVVREVACAACGAPRCELLAVAAARHKSLDAAVAAGARGIEAVRLALLSADRAPVADAPAAEVLSRL